MFVSIVLKSEGSSMLLWFTILTSLFVELSGCDIRIRSKNMVIDSGE